MLDILEIAEEKGIEKGRMLGINEGKLLGILEMLIDDLIGMVPARITERIGAVRNPDVLSAAPAGNKMSESSGI